MLFVEDMNTFVQNHSRDGIEKQGTNQTEQQKEGGTVCKSKAFCDKSCQRHTDKSKQGADHFADRSEHDGVSFTLRSDSFEKKPGKKEQESRGNKKDKCSCQYFWRLAPHSRIYKLVKGENPLAVTGAQAVLSETESYTDL